MNGSGAEVVEQTRLGCESLPTRGNAISTPVRHQISLLLSALVLPFPRKQCPICNFRGRVVTTLFGVSGGDRR
jgi:hypothetical protein